MFCLYSLSMYIAYNRQSIKYLYLYLYRSTLSIMAEQQNELEVMQTQSTDEPEQTSSTSGWLILPSDSPQTTVDALMRTQPGLRLSSKKTHAVPQQCKHSTSASLLEGDCYRGNARSCASGNNTMPKNPSQRALKKSMTRAHDCISRLNAPGADEYLLNTCLIIMPSCRWTIAGLLPSK